VIGDLGAQVRRRRFLAHNREWVEENGIDEGEMSMGMGGGFGENDDSREDRVYRHGDDHMLGDDQDYRDNGDNHFVTGSGQKVAINTSGLSGGDSGGSRDWEGWGT